MGVNSQKIPQSLPPWGLLCLDAKCTSALTEEHLKYRPMIKQITCVTDTKRDGDRPPLVASGL